MLDQLLPAPRLPEVDYVDIGAAPARVRELVRHGDLARSPLIHDVFELRALPGRITGYHEPSMLARRRSSARRWSSTS